MEFTEVLFDWSVQHTSYGMCAHSGCAIDSCWALTPVLARVSGLSSNSTPFNALFVGNGLPVRRSGEANP